MSVTLLSQGKISEYGIAQPSSCDAGDNVLNEWYVDYNVDAHANIPALFMTVLCLWLCVCM